MNRVSKAAKALAEWPEEVRVEIRASMDIVAARRTGRELAMKMGFGESEVTLIAAAISEIGRNIVDYAKEGVMVFERVQHADKGGLLITARDRGPGIPDIDQAMQYGYSSRQGRGVGLPGAKWLMDEFDICSKPGQGTTVTMTKWLS